MDNEDNNYKLAEVKESAGISPVWLIPLVALLIGAWMLLQYQLNKGETIYIKMPHAEGVIVGKTEIKVRSVKMGVIEEVRLADTQDYVIARAQIDKLYGHLLSADAKLWMVSPRIDETGISGLNTLLSGVYIEFSPGESKDTSSHFELQDEPALIDSDIEGRRYGLVAQDAEVIEVGTGVFYKGYKIGQVESTFFNSEQKAMNYGIFIYAPYERLITLNSIFWVNSGIEVDLSADGINLKTGSLTKMLKGGISVGLPAGEVPGPEVNVGHSFTLSTSYQSAMEQRFFDFDYYLIQFEQSIRGLRQGAPVEYRGMRIGTVVETPANVLVDGVPVHFISDNTAVPVLIKVEYGRLYQDSTKARAFWQSKLAGWLEKGLRASLKPGNLITGAVYVDLDFYPDAAKSGMEKLGNYPVFPSTSSGISVLANQVSDVLNKVKNLKLESAVGQMETTFKEYRELAVEFRDFINNPQTRTLPGKFNENFADITESMRQFDKTMRQFETTMASYQQGSQLHQQLSSTLAELKRLSEELQPLTKGINEQPNMFIFDKSLPEDPQPRRKSQ